MVIETNCVRGMDRLYGSAIAGIDFNWMALTGTLVITRSSVTSMADLAGAIASVKFVTTAT